MENGEFYPGPPQEWEPTKKLYYLVRALERACGEVEAADKKMQPHYGPAPSIRTALIRRLIKENT